MQRYFSHSCSALIFALSTTAVWATSGSFNHDNHADILWRDNFSGQHWLYVMQNDSYTVQPLTHTITLDWLAFRGDFNGDGMDDIVWRHAQTGENWIHLMQGNQAITKQRLNQISNDWNIAAIGDFNGDGHDDIIWRDSQSGATWFYGLQGHQRIASHGIGIIQDQRWRIAGTGDLNGDGTDDIVWRHQTTDENYIHLMQNGFNQQGIHLPTVPLQWSIQAIADLNADGHADIVWRNKQDGTNWVYLLHNANIVASHALNRVGDQQWQIIDSGDYNADGHTDLLWRHAATGQNVLYLMQDGQIAKVKVLNQLPATRWVTTPRQLIKQIVNHSDNQAFDMNSGLTGSLYIGADNKIFDLYSGDYLELTWDDSSHTIYPASDGTEYTEVIEDYHRVDGAGCLGTSESQDRIAIKDALTGITKTAFNVFRDTYGPAKLSPDKQHLGIFWQDATICSSGTDSKLSIFTRQGELVHKTNENISDFAWLPDNRLVLIEGRNIFIEATPLSLTGSSFQIPESIAGSPAHLSVSPDGQTILFEMVTKTNSFLSSVKFRNATIWRLNIDGSGLQQWLTSSRTDTPDSEFDDPQLNRPVWSPDGLWTLATEAYTSGSLNNFGLFSLNWSMQPVELETRYFEPIYIPVQNIGLTYLVPSALSGPMALPDATQTFPIRPLVGYYQGEARMVSVNPFSAVRWVPSVQRPQPDAGSLNVHSTQLNAGQTGQLWFTGEEDDQFVLKTMELANGNVQTRILLSSDAADRFDDKIDLSTSTQYVSVYHWDTDAAQEQVRIFDQNGTLQVAYQTDANGIHYRIYGAFKFSPQNEKLLAVVVDDESNNDKRQVLLFNWETGNIEQIFEGVEYSQVTWQPNGDLLLLVDQQLYQSTQQDGQWTVPTLLFELPDRPYSMSVNNSNDRIAFVMNRHIWTAKLDGTDMRPITTFSEESEQMPVWSSDGQTLLIRKSTYDGDDSPDAWLIAADARNVRLYPENTNAAARRIQIDANTYLRGSYGPVFWR